MIPTPDEFAAMTAEERQGAITSTDLKGMSPELQQAYLVAAMTPAPRSATAAPFHIRQRIARKRGNGFYRPTYGPNENGSKTLCGAEAGPDFTWAEGGRLRDDQDACPTCKTIRAKNGARR